MYRSQGQALQYRRFFLVVCFMLQTESHRKAASRYLLTYGASGRSITRDICDESKKMNIYECYTLTQRDLKYTLVRSRVRVVRSTVTSFMCYLQEKYGIRGTSIFGYSEVSMGCEIDEHPGMALIVRAFNENSPDLDCWMEEGNPRSNPKGLLYDHINNLPEETMTRAQLLNRVKSLKGELSECKMNIAELESTALQMEPLRRENSRLKVRLETQLRIFTRAGRLNELPPPSP